MSLASKPLHPVFSGSAWTARNEKRLWHGILFEYSFIRKPGPEVIKVEYNLKLKIKHNDLLLADTCPQAANHCALF